MPHIEIEGNDLNNLKKEDLAGHTKRKLTFKEKIVHKILKKKLKKKSKTGRNRVLNEPKTDGMAIASFVCSLGIFIPFINLVAPFLALVFGIIALGRINEAPQLIKGKGFAIAGIVIGAVGLFVLIIALIWLFSSFAFI
jgi:hypothetical protein